ncbi:hypothetical protein C7N43_16745 [Sphingobacteriales bacterium UPWRP_1]|nr:hypothetical protein C7N43_16745 [Sphingobacteriales bacterium UPWRP_1]
MKFIEKKHTNDGGCIEPERFILWKQQEEKTLYRQYSNNDAISAWDHLPSSSPTVMEGQIAYYSKEELADELLKKQGYLCCYCNRIIHKNEKKRVEGMDLSDEERQANINHNDRRRTIEHVIPKSDNARLYTFDYCNLAVSCSGGERVPQSVVRYCNCGRSDRPIAINPFMPECEDKIYFDIDGNIHSDDENIKYTIGYYDNGKVVEGVLNLIYFAEERAAIIKPYYYDNYDEWTIAKQSGEDLPELKIKTTEQATQVVAKLSKPNENGYFEEFCSAIISVLKRDIIELAQQQN